ncbi:MAG: phosphate ABC transporter substrate-binding protein [Candidatus Omnitrophica bacterium]|nr:phosphate ABC transporter substrate-binding protein [Candidatus Omnitrophota bacterium]
MAKSANYKYFFAAAFGLSALLVLPFESTAQNFIVLQGSDTMFHLNKRWAEEYSKINPNLKIEVSGGGSETGFDALMAGRIDIAAASRAMKESELLAFEDKFGMRPVPFVVAMDGLGVYVHNTNPRSDLTVTDLAGILSGQIRNWSEVGGADRRIDIYSRDRHSGTRTYLKEQILQGKDFSDEMVEVPTTTSLIAAVSRNPNAIGYGGIFAYSEGAHVIRLKRQPEGEAVWPSVENVAAGTYPLSRPLHFYINPASMNKEVKAFVDWILTDGQDYVQMVGYYRAELAQVAGN